MADDDLPEVLRLLHDSDRRWRTLRAEGDQWADPDLSREAFLRNRPQGSVVSSRGTPGPADWDPTWKLWLDLPRFRADFGAAHRARILIIGDGRRVAFSNPASDMLRVTDQRADRPQVGPASELLWPSSLASELHLEALGRRSFLGRDALVVRGRPRGEAEQRRGPRMFMGADEVELALDAERAVLLSLEQRMDGAPFRRVAMTSVAFDEDLDPALFEFPDAPVVSERSLPVPGERRPPFAPHPRQAFPGESVRVAVVFADGRRGAVDNFSSAPAGDVQLIAIHGHGTQTRFDQRFWVEPLPPPGPLGVVVEWERRGLTESRADLDAGAIVGAASRAETLWP